MTNREIFKHIDDGANYYAGMFGEAVHMEKVDKEFYSYVKPKAGERVYLLFIMCVSMISLRTK